MRFEQLRKQARQIRRDIVSMITEASSGHPGGSLSAADILTVLYFDQMKTDPADPKMASRDRFVLSKGHAAPVLYATLCRKGFFEEEHLKTLRKTGSMLQGHPDMKKVPGVDMSTGSLGQGISAAVGMALALRTDQPDVHVYTLLGDGELNEGIVWEAAMSASHYKLSNLTAILDFNGLQIDGPNDSVMSVRPVDQKWRSFGWNVLEADGHNVEELASRLEEAKTLTGPTMIIANTVKGKGVSFMENQAGWHGKAPNGEEYEKAMKELEA